MSLPVWAPSPDEVAAILRARTRGPESRDAAVAGEQGRWSDTTRPTLVQVQELIELACREVQAAFAGREPCTDQLRGSAGMAAAYRAAMLIETSYHPEVTRGDDTAFDALRQLYDQAIRQVADAVVRLCPLDDGLVDRSIPLTPIGRGVRQPLIGRETVW